MPEPCNVHFWALGLSCETPAASGPVLHTTTRELQTRTLKGSGASNTTKIPREDTQIDTKRAKWWESEKKKARNFGASTLRGFHPSGLPPFGASTLQGFHPPGLPPFGASTLRGFTLRGPTSVLYFHLVVLFFVKKAKTLKH